MAKTLLFTGAGVAIVTPFNADGSVNYDSLRNMLEYQVENGTDAIIICGTTGEASTLTDEEQISVVKFAVDVINKRIPVIVYSVAGRTGLNIKPETVAEIAKIDNVVAIKEASGDLSQVAKIANLCGDKIAIYSGNDDQITPLLSLGGKGVISVLSNVAPKYTHDMVMSFLNGDVAKAAEMQVKAIPLVNALFSEVNPIPVKAALNMMGMNAGGYRSPLCEMEDCNKAGLEKAMKDFGIL